MSSPLMPQALLGARLGSCVLERLLGSGGMGAVYLAAQERPRRQVAVKVLLPQLAANEQSWQMFLARFRREADATAALDHSNIVPIFEFGEEREAAYLVMPYLAHGTLANLLERTGPLPLERAVAYLSQAASALDYAHAHGIIHRDVKPSNLLLHPDGRLLLADFGIARPLDRAELALPPTPASPSTPLDTLTQAGTMIGTPQYMAPEQIRGEPVDARTDVYALGMVAYTMLAGRPAYDGTTEGVLFQQLSVAPPPLRSLRPEVPPSVEQVVHWALAKRPEDRPARAGQFAQALSEALRGTPAHQARPQATPMPFAYGMATPPGASAPLARAAYEANSAPTYFAPTGSGPVPRAAAPVWPTPAPAPRRKRWLPRALKLIGGTLGGLVALLLVVSLLAQPPGGPAFSERAARGGPAASTSAAQTATASAPTATATAAPTATTAPTPTPVANWLVVAPSSISLDCGTAKSVRVVLRNAGPAETWWTAQYDWFGGISVTPTTGPLPSGDQVTVTVSNSSTLIGHKGVLTFKPNNAKAGQPAQVSYTTKAC